MVTNANFTPPRRHAPRSVFKCSPNQSRFACVFHGTAAGKVDVTRGDTLVEEEADDVGMAIPAALHDEELKGSLGEKFGSEGCWLGVVGGGTWRPRSLRSSLESTSWPQHQHPLSGKINITQNLF